MFLMKCMILKCMILKCTFKCITNNWKISMGFYFRSMGGWNILPVFCFIWQAKCKGHWLWSFQKVVPGTSNHWPYHTDLLFFCLKFRLSSVCQYLNCFYSMANDYWAIPEKTQTGQLERTYLLKKNYWTF